ncbi:MAG: methyltransferase domain-containing protein [Apilactobacillus sp.]|uniref:class I SAM-dependent methyltransferase n=1 Tax=Apilactobacillus sp. TaxID=2767901 RepID=UPI0025E7292E|nr:class I SAM-dependent methyltransferase [Apilactobacillus sp.]MCT6823341.1 methyltransferase domain-containing protein [Apilactobacillus sp.]MCT6858508.1 methyltransferase domain-containing protein [Apilactobacillus sp.]
MKLEPSVTYSHTLLSSVVNENDIVVDGTIGKGNDTEFLARLVGNQGKVFGFDIQAEAIQKTQERINKNSLSNQVTLINDGHENISNYVEDHIQAAIFNLGYLPGGNKEVITLPETTLKAIQSSLSLLNVGGIVIIILYYGHPGGEIEKEKVLSFVQSLAQKQYSVLKYEFINQINCPPILIAIQKNDNH